MKRTLAFDLDDTLYEERHYVLSGLAAVAKTFAPELAVSADVLQKLFETLLYSGGREQIFNRALMQLGRIVEDEVISAMVESYRRHKPVLSLYTDAEAVLKQLATDYRLVLVTDGLPLMQRNKVEALGIESWFDEIVYCWEQNAPKPNPAGYRLAIGESALAGAIIVGDNPANDGAPAKQLGLPFVRVRSARFYDMPGGDIVVQSLAELPEVLSRVD